MAATRRLDLASATGAGDVGAWNGRAARRSLGTFVVFAHRARAGRRASSAFSSTSTSSAATAAPSRRRRVMSPSDHSTLGACAPRQPSAHPSAPLLLVEFHSEHQGASIGLPLRRLLISPARRVAKTGLPPTLRRPMKWRSFTPSCMTCGQQIAAPPKIPVAFLGCVTDMPAVYPQRAVASWNDLLCMISERSVTPGRRVEEGPREQGQHGSPRAIYSPPDQLPCRLRVWRPHVG